MNPQRVNRPKNVKGKMWKCPLYHFSHTARAQLTSSDVCSSQHRRTQQCCICHPRWQVSLTRSQLSPLLGRSLLLMLQLGVCRSSRCFVVHSLAARLLAVPVSHSRLCHTSKTSFLRRRLSIVQPSRFYSAKGAITIEKSSFASFSTFRFSRLSQRSGDDLKTSRAVHCWKCQSITKLLKAAQSVNHCWRWCLPTRMACETLKSIV